jgi:DNA mismatch endonuclease Vsr
MTDIHSSEIRSYNMSRIRGKNTKPEMLVRKFLFSKGFRYRINVRSLHGSPDIVSKKYRTAIFINGCFWHGHDNCKYYVIPKTKTDWWISKITSNKLRDKKNIESLEKEGWNVIVIWECELKKDKIDVTLNDLVRRIISFL